MTPQPHYGRAVIVQDQLRYLDATHGREYRKRLPLATGCCISSEGPRLLRRVFLFQVRTVEATQVGDGPPLQSYLVGPKVDDRVGQCRTHYLLHGAR